MRVTSAYYQRPLTQKERDQRRHARKCEGMPVGRPATRKMKPENWSRSLRVVSTVPRPGIYSSDRWPSIEVGEFERHSLRIRYRYLDETKWRETRCVDLERLIEWFGMAVSA